MQAFCDYGINDWSVPATVYKYDNVRIVFLSIYLAFYSTNRPVELILRPEKNKKSKLLQTPKMKHFNF